MDLKNKINLDYNEALKAKDKSKISTYRLILSAIKDLDIANRSGPNKKDTDDDDIKKLLKKMIKQRNEIVEEASQMTFRLGINMGDVIVEGSNLYGDGVNVAARLEALSQAGGVCLSKSIHDFVSQKVDLGFQDIGAQQVKNTNVHAFD